MPEIKHNFTGGKMNKDLDERIVPNGEYRDAMNIQVSTSEESNVGTVQNILGNKLGCNTGGEGSYVGELTIGSSVGFDPSLAIPSGSVTVGSISDEKNDTLYWLVAGAQLPDDICSYLNTLNHNALPISFKDMILRKGPKNCEPVFVDQYATIISNVNSSGEFIEDTLTNTLLLDNASWLDNLQVGMSVVAYSSGCKQTTEPVKIKSIGSLAEITSPFFPNYEQVSNEVAPDQHFIDGGGFVPSNPGEGSVNSPANQGTAYNEIWIPVAKYNNNLQVGRKIQLTTLPIMVGGSSTNTTTIPGGFGPQELLTLPINDPVGTTITNLSSAVTVTDTNGNQIGDFIKVTLSQNLEVDGSPLQGPIHSTWQGTTANFLKKQSTYTGELKLDIIFESVPINTQITNTITLPQNSPWLNEIYDIFYPNGVFDSSVELQIKSTGSKGTWPDVDNVGSGYGGCIDPNSVDPPDFNIVPPQYDNEFDIIACVGGGPVTPGGGLGLNKFLSPGQQVTFQLPGENIEDNIIALDGNIDLTSGYDFLYFHKPRVLNFTPDKLITGINIIDDILLWVDGVKDNGTEPKKINIPRSLKGTDISGMKHTLLVNDVLNYNPSNTQIPIKEEHITVIKKSPKIAPSIHLISGRDVNKDYSAIVRVAGEYCDTCDATNQDPNSDIIASSRGNLFDFSPLEPGDRVFLKIGENINGDTNFELDWYADDVVVLKEFDEDGDPPITPISAYTIKARITHWPDRTNSGPNGGIAPEAFGWVGQALVELEILSVDGFPPGPLDGEVTRKYVIDKYQETEKLFEFKFPRFSYRYKYEDGEYSTFAPFSQVAFLPGTFDYHPKKGYNIGMTNRAKSVILKDFVNADTPKDVVEVDILYKEDASPNIYIVDTIKPDDDILEGETINAWFKGGTGQYEITSDTIYAVVPSNQILRPWDNVPLKAQSQEIVGNRVTYGNYFQNFNLKAGNTTKNYYPDFKKVITRFGEDQAGAVKSIKSLREYQIGVVFIDEYGRETPVISNPTGTLKIEKEQGQNSNRLKVGFNGVDYPTNMTYFKFFIKETSGEYYNMAMDRWYEAEDDNIWLAFPSSDRNKVDIDTFLILKKGVESNDIVEEPARYKILAIENEAPDFIKTKKIKVFSAQHNDDSTVAGTAAELFNSNSDLPLQGENTFKVNWDAFSNTSAREIHKLTEGTTDRLYVELTSTISPKISKRYRVASVTTDDVDDNNATVPENFCFTIDGQFGADVNPFTNDSTGQTSNTFKTGTVLNIYRYSVENSSQFDGRFFVKIYRDGTLIKEIINSAAGDNIDYRVVDSKKLYFLNNPATNKQRHKLVFGTSNPGSQPLTDVWSNANSTTGGFRSLQSPNSVTPITWEKVCNAINRMGKGSALIPLLSQDAGNTPDFNGKAGAGWQQFAAYYRGINLLGNSGEQSHGINDRVDEVSLESDIDNGAFQDVWSIDAGASAGTFEYGFDGAAGWDNSPNAKGDNRGSQGGINSNGKKITLSFGGIQPYTDGWKEDNEDTQSHEFFDLASGNTNYSSREGAFIEAIEPGAKFRFREDPSGEIYTITSAISHSFNLRYENLWHGPVASGGYGGNGYNGDLMLKNQIRGMKGFWPQISGVSFSGNLNSADKSILFGIKASTWFRPENYYRTWSFYLDKSVGWNPVAISMGPIDGGKEIRLTPSSNMTVDDGSPNCEVTGLTDVSTAGTYDGAGVNRLEVGMVLESEDGGSTNLADPLIVSKIDGATIYFKKYDPSTSVSITGFTTDSTSAGSLIFKQYSMNGLSPNSAKNINYFNNGKGFDDTNTGTSAVGYTIEFVEPIVDDKLLPSNPAIWETEPKESTDLNIYYEASGYNPLVLSKDTMQSVLPIGSVVSTPSSDAIDPDTTIVSNTVEGYPTAITLSKPTYTTQGSLPPSGAPTGQALGNPSHVFALSTLLVKRPDGSMLNVKIDDNGSDIFNSVPSLKGKVFVINKNIYNSSFWLNWHNCYSFGNGVESNRIRDNFNLPFIGNGVVASTTLAEQYEREHRKHGLIYSGIYNSTSGINNLNQFIQAEKITKDINPIYGSIQKLHMRDSDLVTLCEDKILRIIANKDAVFNADGNPQLIATPNVLGQAVPFTGEYGISKNPESFASESYRAYFSDKVRGAIMRLSRDGLTPISESGMKDWFRDNLKLGDKIIGSYDDRQSQYNVTIVAPNRSKKGFVLNNSKTVSFREQVRGWVSFKSFIPEDGLSCANEYYTFKDGMLWQHHVENNKQNDYPRNTFYGNYTQSSVTVVLNDLPSVIKSFRTLNYEGTQSKIDKFTNEIVDGKSYNDGQYYNLEPEKGWYVQGIKTDQQEGTLNEFIEKEGKWFNYIKGKPISTDKYGSLTNSFTHFNEGDFTIQGIGIYSSSETTGVVGCMDSNASNYDSTATIDSGGCIPVAEGCTDLTASNYDSNANTDNGSCTYPGCTDVMAFNYNSSANFDDGSCIARIYGCTDTSTFTESYTSNESSTGLPFVAVYNTNVSSNPLANTNETSATDASNPCIATILGCTTVTDHCYDPAANTSYHPNFIGSGSCCGSATGCNDSLACNYDSTVAANATATGCIFCSDITSPNVDTIPLGSSDECGTGENENKSGCEYCGGQHKISTSIQGVPIETVSDTEALLIIQHVDYNDATTVTGALPTHQAASVSYYSVSILNKSTAVATTINVSPGTTNATWNDDLVAYSNTYNFNASTYLQGSSNPATLLLTGLDDDTPYEISYYPVCANSNGQQLPEGSGTYTYVFQTPLTTVLGCTDGGNTLQAWNINSNPNPAGGAWSACNYNPLANTDDGTCEYESCAGCLDSQYSEYNLTATGAQIVPGTSGQTISNQAACVNQIISGCTDSTAFNYNASATVDDGSCIAQVFGCLGFGQTFNGAVGTTSSNTLLLDINSNVAANNYGCEAGSTFVQHCNVSPSAPSLINGILITMPGTYAGVSGSTVAATTPIVTSGDGTTCNFDMPTVMAQGVPALGASASSNRKDVEIRIDLGRTPIDDNSNSSNNLRFVTAVQFFDDSDLPVGPTNLGTIDAPHTQPILDTFSITSTLALNAEAAADNDINTLTTSISPGNQYVHSTVVSHNQMASAAQTHNATKVKIFTFTKNYLINRTFGSVQTYHMVLGCTNSGSSNYNANATVDDGGCINYFATGNNQNVGCTDPAAFNYFPNALSNNPNSTCSNCQAPQNPIRAITANAFGSSLSSPILSPDFNIDWNFEEMVSAEHNVLGGIRQYNLVTTQEAGQGDYAQSGGTLPASALQNIAYPTNFSPTGWKHFVAAHVIQFRVNSQGVQYQWRNFQQNLSNAGQTVHSTYTKVQLNHTFNGPANSIIGFNNYYTALDYSDIAGGTFTTTNKLKDSDPNGFGTTGMSSTIFPGTLNTDGSMPAANYQHWGFYSGFYPGDVWEFRVASVCYNPYSQTNSKLQQSPSYSQTYTFTQPSCQELSGQSTGGAITGC